MNTLGEPWALEWPHVSVSPLSIIGLPSANTVEEPPVVTAEQCASQPFEPQHG